jgi:hypothetical protein
MPLNSLVNILFRLSREEAEVRGDLGLEPGPGA